MKSEKGVTLTSLVVYVIAMVLVVGIVATLTNYFYGNLDSITQRTEASKEYTSFSSYFTNEINNTGNSVAECQNDKIVFSSGNQYTFLNGAIYMNKIMICKEVKECKFTYDDESKKVTVQMKISEKEYNNSYAIKGD